MTEVAHNVLKTFRKIYFKTFKASVKYIPEGLIEDPEEAGDVLYNYLTDKNPCMIARLGANELSCLINYIGVKNNDRNMLNYIRGKIPEWWWNEKIIRLMHTGAGFFPPEVNEIEKFCELMLEDIKYIDVLGSWMNNEKYFKNELASVKKVQLINLDPYWSKEPWTRALEDKDVLIIHPFVNTIKRQYKKRELLFEKNLLPEFNLKTIKAVQSIAGSKTGFSTWFEALDYMKAEIDKTQYDICIIGAGAYGLPLAAHVKRSGKKAFHIGGSLQLLFGIRGKRWEKDYHHTYSYADLINEHWV
ncbi:MAG: hypothetical protein ACOCUL_03230, partial [Bacteroidota bacterium]